jgi:peptide/nickel transport system permease protein
MGTYIIKRLFLLLPLFIGITFVSFTILKAIPGDPAIILVGERASPEDIEKIKRHIGSNKGIFSQYGGYLMMLLKGEFGRSYYTQRRVIDDIAEKLPNTAALAISAMLIAVPVGLLFGFVAGLRQNSWMDSFISGLSLTGLSLPVFWTGLLLMYFISLTLKLLPPSGTGFRFIILPSLTLAFPAIGSISRVTRTMVIEISSMPYIKTAISKGVSPLRLYGIHMFKNIIVPVITVIGIDFGSYLSGAVLTETIFGWDGIGRFTFEGIMKRDYPVVMGCIITATMIFVLINLIVDIMYHVLDPRVRFHASQR